MHYKQGASLGNILQISVKKINNLQGVIMARGEAKA